MNVRFEILYTTMRTDLKNDDSGRNATKEEEDGSEEVPRGRSYKDRGWAWIISIGKA